MLYDAPTFTDQSKSERNGEQSQRLTIQNLEKYTDMLSRLKKADEVTGSNSNRNREMDDKRSTSSTSSVHRRNQQLRKLLDEVKLARDPYQPQSFIRRASPGSRSDITEQTEKVQHRKGSTLIDPPIKKQVINSPKKTIDLDLSELQKRIKSLEFKIDEDNSKIINKKQISTYESHQMKQQIQSKDKKTVFEQNAEIKDKTYFQQRMKQARESGIFSKITKPPLSISQGKTESTQTYQHSEQPKISNVGDKSEKKADNSQNSKSPNSESSEDKRKDYLRESRIALQKDKQKLNKQKRSVQKQESKLRRNSSESRNDSLESLKKATEQVKQQLKLLNQNSKTKETVKELSQSTHQSSGKKKQLGMKKCSLKDSTASRNQNSYKRGATRSISSQNSSTKFKQRTNSEAMTRSQDHFVQAHLFSSNATITGFYFNEQEKYDQQLRLQRALRKAQEYKQLYEQAKQDIVKERVSVSQLKVQLEKSGNVHKDATRIQEISAELQELTKCFEKSEQIRKQQKILILKMKTQIENLQDNNAEQALQLSRQATNSRIQHFQQKEVVQTPKVSSSAQKNNQQTMYKTKEGKKKIKI